ncbi:hypothetical protein VPH35_039507 [Triticum aestivum]
MDEMEVDQQQPPHENEKRIFERLMKTTDFGGHSCGILIQPYEFSCSQNGELGEKDGFIHYSNKTITFAGNKDEGFDSTAVKKRPATFLVENEVPFGQLNVIGLNPHFDIGIVKTHGVAYNTQIGRTVTAFAHSSQSVHSWLQSLNNQGFIPPVLRDCIRNLYEKLERLWDKNQTVVDVDLIGTYALNDHIMQIKQSQIRIRNLGDRTPIQGLADMIQNNILNLWAQDIELRHFHAFLLKPNISKQDVLDHPFLGDSPARERRYKKIFRELFTDKQKDWMDNNLNTRGTANGFAPSSWGALHFAKVAISHYHQYDPKGRHQLDEMLKVNLPGLLTGIYGVRFDDAFKALI